MTRRLQLVIGIIIMCATCLSAQTTLMKATVKNGGSEITTENGSVIKISGVLTLPADAFKTITFETQQQPEEPKKDTLVTAYQDDASYSTATIHIDVKPNDTDVRLFGVRYAETRADLNNGNTREISDDFSSSILIDGLRANTTYYYRAFAVMRGNGKEILSEQGTFSTIDMGLNLSIKNITSSYNSSALTLTITGDNIEGASYGVYYSTQPGQINESSPHVAGTTPIYYSGDFVVELTGLEELTTYYVKAYVNTTDGRSQTYETEFKTTEAIKYIEPEAVDLGLSVKWASFNLGATTEASYGGLFGWGDITGEEKRYREGYYAPGVRDTSIGGDARYDIAAAKLGGYWRLPTLKEVLELQKCNPVRTTRDGVQGYLLTGIGSKSGNSIFIPLAGYRQNTELFQQGFRAYLWTDSINASELALNVEFIPSNGVLAGTPIGKANGATVRAVWDDGTGTPIEDDPEEPPVVEDLSNKAVPGSVNNSRTGAIPQDGVDLGLSVKWARWNVGAMTTTGDAGRYYAWGDTIHHDAYTPESYESNPYYNIPGNENGFVKIDAENDVATVLWGDEWRMPTGGEFMELFLYCEKVWTCENNVWGYRFTSTVNGQSIFIPAGGHMINSSKQYYGEEGRYWTSSVWATSDDRMKKEWATTFYYHHGIVEPEIMGLQRYNGCLIRPVRNQ